MVAGDLRAPNFGSSAGILSVSRSSGYTVKTCSTICGRSEIACYLIQWRPTPRRTISSGPSARRTSTTAWSASSTGISSTTTSPAQKGLVRLSFEHPRDIGKFICYTVMVNSIWILRSYRESAIEFIQIAQAFRVFPILGESPIELPSRPILTHRTGSVLQPEAGLQLL